MIKRYPNCVDCSIMDSDDHSPCLKCKDDSCYDDPLGISVATVVIVIFAAVVFALLTLLLHLISSVR